MGKNSEVRSKSKGKGSQLVIRVDKAERKAFVALCETLDTSAAREIRRFMRDFVARNTPAAAAPSVAEASAEPAMADPVAPPAPPSPDNVAAETPAATPKPRRSAKAKAQ